MLIYRRQVENLLQYKNKTDDLMVSLYLNVAHGGNILSQLNALAHNTRNRLKENLEKEKLRNVDRLLSEIEEYAKVSLINLKNTQLIVIFADTSGFWQEYRLPVSLPGKLIVEEHPYVRPLTLLLDKFERYLIVVADSRHARLFALYLGDFEERPDVFMESEVPDRVKVKQSMAAGSGAESTLGVYSGVGDGRIESHIEEHIHRHLRVVADKTFEYFKERKFTKLIIGTPNDKNRPWLKSQLHSYLSERLAGEFTAQPTLRDDVLKQRALEAAEQYEREKDVALVNTIFEKSGPGDMAILGVDPVIKALGKSQVHTLAVERGYTRKGYICYKDHTLSSEQGNCPLCNESMAEVNDILDEMVEIALLQNSEIRHIMTRHDAFSQYHVGAILRFTMQ